MEVGLRGECPSCSVLKRPVGGGHSSLAAKETILKHHLIPALGMKRLDAVTNEDVQRLKLRLEKRSTKTVNNVLTTFDVMLKKGLEWGLIDRMPCAIKLLPVLKGSECFHDFAEFERLVVQYRVKRAARRAGVREGVHILRHSFCSRLAMKGASAIEIQRLAGHTDLSTTQRYLHLSPVGLGAAIQLLDTPGLPSHWGAHGEAKQEDLGKASS